MLMHLLPPALQELKLPLRIRLWDGSQIDLNDAPEVTLIINDAKVLQQLANPSLDNLGQAYAEGLLDIEGSLQTIMAVADAMSTAILGDDTTAAGERIEHDKQSDAAAISYHYDLSNEFYQLWLDPDMVYSCAYFATGTEDLAQAQQAKLRHLCRKLRLQPGDKMLDVGCGWGGLARFAAREFGVEVFGITLSQAQLELARERVAAEGLQQQITLQYMDYRDLPQDQRFDKAVSVGMFEHVGHANLPLYCQRLFEAVKPGALVMNHGITSRYTDGRSVGRGAGEFIDRYVFPQGELPHLATISKAISDAGLEIIDVESLRLHYARTLRFWSDNLEANLDKAKAMVPDMSLRIWRIYLAGCAYGFQHGWMNLHQILAVKPLADGGHRLPWSREDIYR